MSRPRPSKALIEGGITTVNRGGYEYDLRIPAHAKALKDDVPPPGVGKTAAASHGPRAHGSEPPK